MVVRLRSSVEWFIAAIFVAGAASFVLAFVLQPVRDPLGLATVVALAALAEMLAVRLHHDGRASVSVASTVLAALVWGFPGAAAVSATIAIVGWLCFSGREAQKLAFNFGQHGLASFVAAAIFGGLATASLGPLGAVATSVLSGVAAGALLFAIQSSAVAVILSLSSKSNIFETYRSNFVWLIPHYVALGAIGGGLAAAYDVLGIAGLVVLSLPLLISRHSMKQVLDQTRDNVLRLEKSNQQLQGAYGEIRVMSDELTRAYTGTLESLVAALDVRDQETRGHSQRVANHSLDIAKILGMSDEQELATIYRGALMHDVGKIGVPDAILLKPAKLTDDEWQFMRKHPAMGYRILAQVPYLRPTAKIVLAHHERWDGDGYPRRLKGENIPLGARIFAICDTYDAIISDRPYRAGQTPDEALKEILRCAGSQFDPKVVEAFEAAFPRWREEEVGAVARPLYLPAWRKKDDAPGRAAS